MSNNNYFANTENMASESTEKCEMSNSRVNNNEVTNNMQSQTHGENTPENPFFALSNEKQMDLVAESFNLRNLKFGRFFPFKVSFAYKDEDEEWIGVEIVDSNELIACTYDDRGVKPRWVYTKNKDGEYELESDDLNMYMYDKVNQVESIISLSETFFDKLNYEYNIRKFRNSDDTVTFITCYNFWQFKDFPSDTTDEFIRDYVRCNRFMLEEMGQCYGYILITYKDGENEVKELYSSYMD